MFLSISLCQSRVELEPLGALSHSSGEQSINAGQITAEGNCSSHFFPNSRLCSNLSRSVKIQQPIWLDTSSPADFAKESLHFSIIEPTVQSVITDYAFFFGKRSFVGLDPKYVFTYLHICH